MCSAYTTCTHHTAETCQALRHGQFEKLCQTKRSIDGVDIHSQESEKRNRGKQTQKTLAVQTCGPGHGGVFVPVRGAGAVTPGQRVAGASLPM